MVPSVLIGCEENFLVGRIAVWNGMTTTFEFWFQLALVINCDMEI